MKIALSAAALLLALSAVPTGASAASAPMQTALASVVALDVEAAAKKKRVVKKAAKPKKVKPARKG